MKWLIITILIVIVLGLGVGGYMLLTHPSETSQLTESFRSIFGKDARGLIEDPNEVEETPNREEYPDVAEKEEAVYYDRKVSKFNNQIAISKKEYKTTWIPYSSEANIEIELQIHDDETGKDISIKSVGVKQRDDVGSFYYNTTKGGFIDFKTINTVPLQHFISTDFRRETFLYSEPIFGETYFDEFNITQENITGYNDSLVSQKVFTSYQPVDQRLFDSLKQSGYFRAEAFLDPVIAACGDIILAGDYTMLVGISGTGTCLNIQVSDVTLDCGGNSITYDTGGGNTGWGINISRTTGARVSNVTVKNCLIQKSSNAGSSGHGIVLYNTTESLILANTILTNGSLTNVGVNLTTTSINNSIINNTIVTRGGGNGYGISLSGNSNYNLIHNNSIFTNGNSSAANNYGIFAVGNVIGNNMTNNNIITLGLSQNYGINLQQGANETGVYKNQIKTNNNNSAGSSSGYGIYLNTNVRNNNISSNIINTSGNNTPSGGNSFDVGIYLNTGVHYNTIENNTIVTNGHTGLNIGIDLITNAIGNNITSNDIKTFGNSTSGTTNNYGIAIQTGANNSIISNNIISTSGTTSFSTTGNHGIFLSTDISNNLIEDNYINTTGAGTGGQGGNNGIQLTTRATFNTLDGNNIITGNLSGGSNHGIQLVTNSRFNNITNNNVMVNGTSTNYGIFIQSGSNNTIITGNSIRTGGVSSGGNNGVFLQTNIFNCLIDNNIINTSSLSISGSNFGVYISTNARFNVVSNNIIRVGNLGNNSGSSNVGIYLATNVRNNNITNNYVNTSGTSGNQGIRVEVGSNDTLISGNAVMTYGTSNNNYGIYVNTNTKNVNISSNSINTTEAGNAYAIFFQTGVLHSFIERNFIMTKSIINSANYGIYLQGNIIGINISSNSINTSASGSGGEGIRLDTGVNRTLVENNNIFSGGTGSINYGIHILTRSSLNNISNNYINTTGTANNEGIRVGSGSNNNVFYGNVIRTFGTTASSISNHGIHLISSFNNTFQNIIINYSRGNGIVIDTHNASNNNFSQITFLVQNASLLDINISTTAINDTVIQDSNVGMYNIQGIGGRLYVTNSTYGEIFFIRNVSGNGNLSRDIVFNFNSIFTNGSTRLNASANISIFGLPTNLETANVLRDGNDCTDCTIFGAIDTGIIRFNVSSWSTYSIEFRVFSPSNIVSIIVPNTGNVPYVQLTNVSEFSGAVPYVKLTKNKVFP